MSKRGFDSVGSASDDDCPNPDNVGGKDNFTQDSCVAGVTNVLVVDRILYVGVLRREGLRCRKIKEERTGRLHVRCRSRVKGPAVEIVTHHSSPAKPTAKRRNGACPDAQESRES